MGMAMRGNVGFGRMLGVVGLALVAAGAIAQDAARPMRVGVLLSGSSTQWSPFDDALVEGLRERGYVEGKNLVVVRRYGELSTDRIRNSAAELATMRLDTVVTSCTATTRSVAEAAPAMPIVIASIGDPVLAGLVPSLAHPGGNVTGRSSVSVEIIPKRLELLRAVLPESARSGARIAVMMNPREPSHLVQWERAVTAAQALNLQLVRIETNGPSGIDRAIEALPTTGAKGLLVFSDDPAIIEHRARIAAAALRNKLPMVTGPRVFALDGALMTYGMDMTDEFRASASYVVKVAGGAKPADLPIEQPTRFELTVNLRTAAALGIKVPREVLLLANGTIE